MIQSSSQVVVQNVQKPAMSNQMETNQMETFMDIMRQLKNANDRPDGENVCLAVDGTGLNRVQHWGRFIEMFKAMKDKPFCTLTTTLRVCGDDSLASQEVIGVPKYEAIFYISKQGHVRMSGHPCGCPALLEKMGVEVLCECCARSHKA